MIVIKHMTMRIKVNRIKATSNQLLFAATQKEILHWCNLSGFN